MLHFFDIQPLQSKRATEADLRRVFETFGVIERIRMVRDKRGKSRGYAFIVYERERDMKGIHSLSFLLKKTSSVGNTR